MRLVLTSMRRGGPTIIELRDPLLEGHTPEPSWLKVRCNSARHPVPKFFPPRRECGLQRGPKPKNRKRTTFSEHALIDSLNQHSKFRTLRCEFRRCRPVLPYPC